jgi:uncharacterized coiled-coil protein SlyX
MKRGRRQAGSNGAVRPRLVFNSGRHQAILSFTFPCPNSRAAIRVELIIMNCLRCNNPSPEGKKFCADCGSPLDLEAIRFEARVGKAVEETLNSKFKDQKFIQLETSQAIAERLQGWAKLFGFFVGLPFAMLLLIVSVFGIEKVSDLRELVDGVEKQVKPRVQEAKSSAEQAQAMADDAQKKSVAAEKTVEGVVQQTKQQLGSATQLVNNVHDLSQRVSDLETKASGQMQARVTELNQKVDAATKNIEEQQKKLASTDELVKALFSKGQTEYFVTSQPAPNVIVVPLPDPTKGCFVFMLLRSAPIFQTTEIKWRVASQPRSSYSVNLNVLFFFWGDPSDNLKQNPLEVTYVPDPTLKTTFKKLTLKDNGVYADDAKLFDVPVLPKQPVR